MKEKKLEPIVLTDGRRFKRSIQSDQRHRNVMLPKLAILLAIYTVLGAGCAQSTVELSTPQPAATQHAGYLDVLEAIYRYQFDHNESAGQRRVSFFFLRLDHADPPSELMGRFTTERPLVLPASLSVSGINIGVMHKVSKEGGLIFFISTIRWTSADRVEAAGGYYEGGESSASGVYELTRVGRNWMVVKYELHSIS